MATATGERAATDAAAARAATIASTTESMASNVPTIETAAHARTLDRLARNRDVYAGTEAIRAGGTRYLPKFRGETMSQYDARRTISAVFNGFARTVEAIYGIVCEPEPTLSDDMPQELVDMWENASGDGVHGAVLTRRLVEAGTVDGYAGFLTEYPRPEDVDLTRPGVSLAAAVAVREGKPFDESDIKALGIQPYFILVKVDECLPIYRPVNGRQTLVMFIRKQATTEPKGDFGFTPVVRYFVYRLTPTGVTWERWTEIDGEKKRDRGPAPLKGPRAIPWSPLRLGKKLGDHEYRPLLDDLSYLTLTHHRIATGILSLEENCFVPTIWRVGAPKDPRTSRYPELVRGSEAVIEIPYPTQQGVSMPNPPVGFLSPPTDVLEPAMKSLENCKAEMGAMGATFLAPQLVQETATAKRMDKDAEQASIATISRDVKDCLEAAFQFAGQYIGKVAGSVGMNADFVGEGVDYQVLTVLVTNYQSDKPIVTLEDIRYYLKNGQLPEEFEPGDVTALLTLTAKLAQDKANAQRLALASVTTPTDTADTNSDPGAQQ